MCIQAFTPGGNGPDDEMMQMAASHTAKLETSEQSVHLCPNIF